MSLKYISYIQTETLFKHWKTIQGIKESLESELSLYGYTSKMGDVNDYIYTKVIGNKGPSDMPHSGKLSDSTGDTALNIEDMWNKDVQRMRDKLMQEKLYIELVDDKLNLAYKRLDPMQRELLEKFYWENKTWDEVLEILKKKGYYLTKRQASYCRRNCLKTMQTISKITVDIYDNVIKLLEV